MFVDDYFFDSYRGAPSAPALWVDTATYTYADLATRALAISRDVSRAGATGFVRPAPGEALHTEASAPAPCLLFAYRSVNAYAGLLGILHAGHGYIPLSPKSPVERNLQIIRTSGARVVLVDKKWQEQWDALALAASPSFFDDYQILTIDTEGAWEAPSAALGASGGPASLAAPSASVPLSTPPAAKPVRRASDLAYVLFTSGTTGTPKGVKISHASIATYIANEAALRPTAPGDRYSQFFDLTSDPSLEEMFLCWRNGACLYALPQNDPLSTASFIRQHGLTHLSSVPSTIAFLKQYRKLKPGMFPSLKLCSYGGEAFRGDLFHAWALAAPNAIILNLYGPTEATIAVTRYARHASSVHGELDGIVPIGTAMSGIELVVLDEEGAPAPRGATGELLIGGTQLAMGYIGATASDNARFFERAFDGYQATRWYRTGDLVSVAVAAAPGGGMELQYHGRVDSQVKIRGNRIELQEVESVLGTASGATMTAAMTLPADEDGVSPGIVAFINTPVRTAGANDATGAAEDALPDDEAILQRCRAQLPAFAVPRRIIRLDDFPLNLMGKVDRQALMRHYHANVKKIGVA